MTGPIKIFNSVEGLALFFSQKLAALIEGTPQNGFFSLALSGGSTPKYLFSYLASNCRERIDWQKVNLFWGDERCVDSSHDESNFRMAKESLLDQVPIPPSNIFRIIGEAAPEKEAFRYSEAVRKQLPSQDGIPRFDCMMLGLGEDGHTASIFPENIELYESSRLFEATVNPYTGQRRITATGKIINHAKLIVLVVTGEQKAEVFARIIERKEGWEKFPASRVHPENGEMVWLTDERAASKLMR